MFPHCEVEEQPSKKPKKRFQLSKRKKGRQKVRQLFWKLFHGCVVSRKTQSHHDFQKAWSTGETRGKNDEYDSHSLRSVKQFSEKIKGHRVEKYMSKILISEVPTLWNLRTDLKKRLKDNNDAPAARLGILPKNIYKFTEKQGYILLARGRMGTPGCVNKSAGGKIVCGRFRS